MDVNLKGFYIDNVVPEAAMYLQRILNGSGFIMDYQAYNDRLNKWSVIYCKYRLDHIVLIYV